MEEDEEKLEKRLEERMSSFSNSLSSLPLFRSENSAEQGREQGEQVGLFFFCRFGPGFVGRESWMRRFSTIGSDESESVRLVGLQKGRFAAVIV